MHTRTLVAAALCLPSFDGLAELKQSAPDGAVIEHRYRLAVTPGEAWQALIHPERWWPQDHPWLIGRQLRGFARHVGETGNGLGR